MRFSSRLNSDDRERGAVLAIAAVGVVMALVAAALSVDIGSQAWKKRDLQKVADLAALDASWVIPEVQAGEHASPTQAAQWAAEDSADRNGLDLGLPDADVVARLGDWDSEDRTFTECGMGAQPTWLGGLGAVLNGLTGTLANLLSNGDEDGLRDFIWTDAGAALADLAVDLGDCEPNAVKVRATDTARRYFMPGATDPMVAAAGVAAFGGDRENDEWEEDVAVFTIGSFAARAEDVSGSAAIAKLLEALLGDTGDAPVSLDDQSDLELVSYNGLANANVSLRALLLGVRDAAIDGAATVGTLDELLALDMTASELLSATAHALRRMEPDEDGNVDGYPALAAEVEVLEQYSRSFGYAGRTFQLGDIIRVATNDTEETDEGFKTRALTLETNVLDLVMAGAMAGTGDNAVVLEGSSLLPAGIGSVTMRFTVIEPPVTAIGGVGTVAQTAQVRGTLTVELAEPLSLGGLPLGDILGPVGDVGGGLIGGIGDALGIDLGELESLLDGLSSPVVLPFEVRAVQATAELTGLACPSRDTVFDVVNQLVDTDAADLAIAFLRANLPGELTDVLSHELLVGAISTVDGINVLTDTIDFFGPDYPQTAVVSSDLSQIVSSLLADVEGHLEVVGEDIPAELQEVLDELLLSTVRGAATPVRELLERFSVVGSDLTVNDVACEGEEVDIVGPVSGIPVLVQ